MQAALRYIMKAFVGSFRSAFAGKHPCWIFPCLFNSNTPAVYGNSPGKFSCNCQRKISPQSLYFGNTTLGMRVPLNDVVVSGCLITLSRTVYSKKSPSYFFTASGHCLISFLQSGCKLFFKTFLKVLQVRECQLTSFSPIMPVTWYNLEAMAALFRHPVIIAAVVFCNLGQIAHPFRRNDQRLRLNPPDVYGIFVTRQTPHLVFLSIVFSNF